MEKSDTFYVIPVNPSAYVMPSMIVDSGSSCNILPEATFRKDARLEVEKL